MKNANKYNIRKYIIDIVLLVLKKYPDGNLSSQYFREHIADEVHEKWMHSNGLMLSESLFRKDNRQDIKNEE